MSLKHSKISNSFEKAFDFDNFSFIMHLCTETVLAGLSCTGSFGEYITVNDEVYRDKVNISKPFKIYKP